MNRQIAWYIGFFIAGALAGALTKLYTDWPPIARTATAVVAGIIGGLVAERLRNRSGGGNQGSGKQE